MPVFSKASFEVNLGIVTIGGEMDESDRQCAWELYCELVSRLAVVGKVDDEGVDTFEGEVLSESFQSLYTFFGEARGLMRQFPVGKLPDGKRAKSHLGFFIAGLLEAVLRPFLEKWQASYRYWWEEKSDKEKPPFARQEEFPELEALLEDWARVRAFCRESATELASTFKLPDVAALVQPELKRAWREETGRVVKGL